MKRLLSYDPETKIRETMSWDEDTGKYVIESMQDCTDAIGYNALQAEFHDKKANRWFVGHINEVIATKWAKEWGVPAYTHGWMEMLKRRLKDPDFRKFNVNNIRL